MSGWLRPTRVQYMWPEGHPSSRYLGGSQLWVTFLVVENLDESDQFILGRDSVRNVDVTIDLNDGLIRFKDPEKKNKKKPVNKILVNQAKLPIFLD